jgi:hypothetical protein
MALMGDIKRTYTLELTDYQAAMLADELASHAQRLTWMAEELEAVSSVLSNQRPAGSTDG